MTFPIILIIIFAYFLGSISSAILICKILHHPDPRKFGSKNPGATNILRIAGHNIAIIVLIIDILKGITPVWIGYYLNIPPSYIGIVAISVCLGHMYPIFFKFYGGKGVATAFGAITTMGIDIFIIMISTWILTIISFKYSSLASIITAIIIPCYTWYFHTQYFLPITIISSLIIIRHIDNIKRLWYHQEKKYLESLKNNSKPL